MTRPSPATGCHRQRDLLPLPEGVLLASASGQPQGQFCRTTARRALRRHHAAVLAEEAVATLNELYGNSANDVGVQSSPTAAQAESLTRIHQAAQQFGQPPEGMTGEGALRELLAKTGYDGEPSTLVPLDVDALSLPSPGFTPVALEEIGGGFGRKVVERLEEKLLPDIQGEENIKKTGLRRPYSDPVLRRRPRVYARFLRRLLAAGLVELRLARPRRRVGAFAVRKKGGEQRLVIDARLPNACFEDSDTVALATGQSFAAISVDEGPPIAVGGVDIEVAFYAMQLPPSLRSLFGLDPIAAGTLGVRAVGGVAVEPGAEVFPVLRVLPMGWSLALWACQQVHEHIARRVSGISSSNALIDRAPCPSMQPIIHTEYVDNFVALGRSVDHVLAAASGVKDALEAEGLPTHPVEAAAGGSTLGWTFAADRAAISVSQKTAWRLRIGIQHMISRRKATGREVMSVIGNYSFRALLRRELLSVLSSVYVFIERHFEQRVELWPSVVRELSWCASLLPLAFRDLQAQWSDSVSVFDASSWGCGVMVKAANISDIQEAGRYNERWRFSKEGEHQAKPRDDLTTSDWSAFCAPGRRVPPVGRGLWGGRLVPGTIF